MVEVKSPFGQVLAKIGNEDGMARREGSEFDLSAFTQ
jgi:hypothetical protein